MRTWKWVVLAVVVGMGSAYAAEVKPWDKFVNTLKDYRGKYVKAPNEIKKSALFTEAREFDKKFFEEAGNEVTDWPGTLTELMTQKGGGSLSLRVSAPTKGAFRVSFSEGLGFMEKGISKDSPVYAQAAELSKGSCVLFSGTVVPHEDSMGEEGAMEAPEYKIKFSSLKPCPKK